MKYWYFLRKNLARCVAGLIWRGCLWNGSFDWSDGEGTQGDGLISCGWVLWKTTFPSLSSQHVNFKQGLKHHAYKRPSTDTHTFFANVSLNNMLHTHWGNDAHKKKLFFCIIYWINVFILFQLVAFRCGIWKSSPRECEKWVHTQLNYTVEGCQLTVLRDRMKKYRRKKAVWRLG